MDPGALYLWMVKQGLYSTETVLFPTFNEIQYLGPGVLLGWWAFRRDEMGRAQFSQSCRNSRILKWLVIRLLEGCNKRAMLSCLSTPLKTVSWSSVYVKSTCPNPLPALGLLILSALFISIDKARALPDQLPIKLVWKIHALLGYKPFQKAWLEDYCDQEPNVWKLDRKKTNTHQALTKLKKSPPK